MNELELLRELGDEARLPELGELSPARARLISAIGAERTRHAAPGAGGAVSSVWRRRPARSRRLALAGAAAALVTAGGVIATVPMSGSAGSSATSIAHLTAAQVLSRAAFVALDATSLAPLPDRFVYTQTEDSQGPITQSWLSVDGTRSSLVGSHTIPGCVNRRLTFGAAGNRSPASRPCTPVRAYFPDMPTQPARMLPYLEKTQGVAPGDLNDLAKTVGEMLDSDYLLPTQQAALYEFLATTRGINVEPGVKDAAGRPGIGVGWSLQGSKTMLIFDATTYAYLGTSTEGVHGELSGAALLRVAIVPKAGQLPSAAELRYPSDRA